jgi:outer membrane protein W
MTRIAFAGLVAAAVLAATTASDAQNFNRRPAFGTVNLNAGFAPDPYWVRVRAGGTRPASSVSGCGGSIADAPDVRLNYNAGGGFALTFFVRSNADTIVVVNDPSGAWYCDDDSGGNLDPQLTFSNPLSGQYDIWIGHYEGGRGIPAQLGITER